MDFCQNTYRGRLYRAYILDTPFTINFLWSAIKVFLEDTTAQKIQFHKSNTCDEMFTHINKDQIEKKFGGNANDMKDNYWYLLLNIYC